MTPIETWQSKLKISKYFRIFNSRHFKIEETVSVQQKQTIILLLTREAVNR